MTYTMKYSSTKDDAGSPESSSVAFGVSRDLWPTLELIIQEAESVAVQANTIIDTLVRGLDDESFAVECQRQLNDTGLYALAVGTWKPGNWKPGAEAKGCCEVFWSSLRAALYDQFGGFAVPDDENRTKIREAAVKIGTAQEPGEVTNKPFWDVSPENTISRIWVLIAHAKLLRAGTLQTNAPSAELSEPGRTQEQHEEPASLDFNPPFDQAREVLSKLSKDQETQGLRELRGSNQEKSFERVRLYAAWRLLNRYFPASADQSAASPTSLPQTTEAVDARRMSAGIPDDDYLIQQFLLLLSRGAESALSVEVSLLMRVLVGRYLNDSSGRLEWAKESLQEGVRYVLRQQNELDGSWEIPVPKSVSSPFLHRFSPLLHILDLDTELLRPEGASLVRACARALAWARRTLSVQDAVAREACRNLNSLEIGRLTDSVVMGLSLGRTVYDRLKDLLSDSTLRHRGAVDGHTEFELKDIPNSLGFRDNIDRGVLNEWNTRSGQRPGAILIYGPPGTGKTTVASIIASELNKSTDRAVASSGTDRWRFLTLSAADFAREGSDGIVACAEQLFSELKRVRRCVVLLDEMEEFLLARGPGSHRDSRLVTTAFLPLLQEAVKAREVILVVATNFVGSIDPAVTRHGRFDLILPLGPPDEVDRSYILNSFPDYKKVLEFLRLRNPDTSWFEEAVVEYSMGYSRTELESFFREFFGTIKEKVEKGTLPDELHDRHELQIALWRLRAYRVPMALSGRAGSDWRTFEDEAKRYHRCVPEIGLGKEEQRYWREPALPLQPYGSSLDSSSLDSTKSAGTS